MEKLLQHKKRDEMQSPNQNPLMVEVAGLKLKNPTILASGILGTTSEIIEKVAKAGAGAIVTKSVGLKPRRGYSNPTLIQLDYGIINAMGLPNPGIHQFKKEIEKLKDLPIPLIVSVYGFSPQEYAEVAEEAVEAGADAVELNLSCPHVGGTGTEIGSNPKLAMKVIREVKERIKEPVIAKITANVADLKRLARSIEEAGADAITAINTIRAMAIDIETTQPILSNIIGGLSGPAVKPIAVRCVYEIYEAVDIPIIGCGGIIDWRDAVEFILAGASAIQIGTVIAYRGLSVFTSIKNGIFSYLKRKGYESVKDIVGLSHKV